MKAVLRPVHTTRTYVSTGNTYGS